MNLKKLSGKTAIITGAGRGIGKSIALALAKEGANVVAVARSRSEIDNVAAEAKNLRVESLAIRADVSREEDVDLMVEKALTAFGRIDILFNNAGIHGPGGPITQTKVEDWDKTIDTNLKGVFLCSRAILPQMMDRKEGNIINISTGAGRKKIEDSFLSPAGSLVYSVSKFGVEGFTLALAAQVNHYRINVNAIRPGWTDTTFHPMPVLDKKMRKADDIGKIAVFLACQGPMGLTGQSIDAQTWETIYLSREL
ncbi:MAG: SDR family oxidoreductase [Desulfobacterales bacterium]|nr:SDR family oxidoreductase [Desulfobacterales bacterium]